MTLKNIMVHLDHGPRTPDRLALAIGLAKKNDARLLGVFTEISTTPMAGILAAWPPEAYRQAAAASQAAFTAATADLSSAVWRDANRGSASEIVHALIEAAQHVDLAILGQDAGSEPALVPAGTAEQIILNCGRPVLVLPYTGHPPTIGRRPLIAWNHSREAARAVNDATALITGCDGATVISMVPHPEAERGPAQDCLTHLACHGITAKVEIVVPEGVGVMDLLLNLTADTGADLLVMGAHGHIGFPYLHRGGGTRHMLAHMTVPMLLSY